MAFDLVQGVELFDPLLPKFVLESWSASQQVNRLIVHEVMGQGGCLGMLELELAVMRHLFGPVCRGLTNNVR